MKCILKDKKVDFYKIYDTVVEFDLFCDQREIFLVKSAWELELETINDYKIRFIIVPYNIVIDKNGIEKSIDGTTIEILNINEKDIEELTRLMERLCNKFDGMIYDEKREWYFNKKLTHKNIVNKVKSLYL